jgi:enoyl-CoA hydratase/carnithine racemase
MLLAFSPTNLLGVARSALAGDCRIASLDTKMLVRDDVMKDLVFTGRILPASEGAQLGLVTRLPDDPVAAAMDAAREIAGRSPSAVRGAKQLINRISNAGAAEHFAAEREIIFTLIGKPHQVEAITANFENRPAKFEDVG